MQVQMDMQPQLRLYSQRIAKMNNRAFGGRRGPILRSPFTTANMDTLLFGNHNGISVGTRLEIQQPMPTFLSNVRMSQLTQKQNPWYMAPGWNSQRRYIDVRSQTLRAGGAFNVPRMFVNPWDQQYGLVGQYGPMLAAIRANQAGSQSMI